MSALPKHRLSQEEYLAIERAAERKSEYIDGEMYLMAGAGGTHNIIIWNIAASFHRQFRGRPCQAYINDMRLRVADSGLYTYPDVIALCGKAEFLDGRSDTLLNPKLIVEVLSPSTMRYDRFEKFRRYRQLLSLTDYLLVAQDQMHVEHYRRPVEADADWTVLQYDEPSDLVPLLALEAGLLLADIYERVDFPATPDLPSR